MSTEAPFVATWTGREATALQAALRMTNEAFAARLGVATRTVANWHARSEMEPRLEMQQLLDALFGKHEDDVRAMRRFALYLAEPADDERTHRDSPIVMVAEMAVMQARINELEARLAGGKEVAA